MRAFAHRSPQSEPARDERTTARSESSAAMTDRRCGTLSSPPAGSLWALVHADPLTQDASRLSPRSEQPGQALPISATRSRGPTRPPRGLARSREIVFGMATIAAV